MNPTAIRSLFVVAAVYDGLLGLLFLFAPNWAFTQFDITPPNHVGCSEQCLGCGGTEKHYWVLDTHHVRLMCCAGLLIR